MINSIVRYAASVVVVFMLSSCGGKPETHLASDSSTPSAAPDPNVLTGPAIEPEFAAALKDLIAKDGGQCTHIVSAQGEDASSRIKVTCSERVGDSNTVSYTVDPGI